MQGFDPEYEKNIERSLEWFSKKTGYLVGEEEFKQIDLMGLRRIFGITDSFVLPEGMTALEYDAAGYDPYMIYCYAVDEKKAKELQKYVKHKIKVDKYNYKVGAASRSS